MIWSWILYSMQTPFSAIPSVVASLNRYTSFQYISYRGQHYEERVKDLEQKSVFLRLLSLDIIP